MLFFLRPAHRSTGRPRAGARALVCGCAALLGACYDYVPQVAQQPALGSEVRLTLTDLGSVAAASAVGPRVESIDGRIARISADSVVVAATQTTQRGGAENTWNGERVALPRSAVASIGVRRLSASRTALASAAGVAVVVGTIVGFHVGGSGNGSGISKLPTPQ